MENLYNMNNFGRNQLAKDKRLHSQAADFLKEYDNTLKESLEAKENEKKNIAMSGARFSQASAFARSKNRQVKLTEQINYNETLANIGLTEMVSEVVKEALLLDESELAKVFPEYDEHIHSVVSNFLENANINQNITNENTLQLIEYIYKKAPNAREGVSLTEDELANYIAASKPVHIDKTIKELAGDVSTRVASLMEKENKKIEEIDAEVNRAQNAQEKDDENAVIADLINQLLNGQISEEDLTAMVQNNEISQDVFNAVIAAAEPEEEEIPEEQPVEEPVEGTAQPDELDGDPALGETEPVVPAASAPKKQIQMLPDGTLNVNIYESKFVKETPRCGLIESLAVNEAQNMIAAGKGYDGDYCLAKAIIYTTITEAMDEMGLMNVSKETYNNIIKAAGGTVLTEQNNFKKKEQNIILKPLTESILVSQYVDPNNKQEGDLAERIRKRKNNRLLTESES